MKTPQGYPQKLPGIISRKERADRLRSRFSFKLKFVMVILADGSFLV